MSLSSIQSMQLDICFVSIYHFNRKGLKEKKEHLLGFILFIEKGSSPSLPEIVSLAHSPKSYLIYFRSNTYFVST